MFDFVSSEFRPFIGVGMLAVLFLAVTSLITKYRTWQAEKMAKAQGLLRGANQIRRALARLERLPVPKDVADLCKGEQLLRYQGVRLLFPGFEGLDDLVLEAERGCASIPGEKAWLPPELENGSRFDAYTKSLTEILDFLSTERCMTEIDAAGARDMREKLRTLRAEVQYRYYRETAIAAAKEGKWDKAVKDTLMLLSLIKEKAAPNERGKELYHLALGLYRQLSHKQMPENPEDEAGQDAGIA